jgi:hypothetical protein
MGRLKERVISLRDREPRVIRLDEREGDSQAAYDLAVTTHRFSKRAQAMVDDKLSLSAALMRAGEVDEARRLLAEAEEDLRSEEDALLRQIEELGNFRDMHRQKVVVIERDRISRSSLMRTLAVAVAFSAVVAVATMGGAVIGLFEQRPQIKGVQIEPTIDNADISRSRSISPAAAKRGITVRINGIRVVLTRAEWRALKRAQRSGDDEAVTDLLGTIAPELTASAPGEIAEIIAKIGDEADGAVKDPGGSTKDGDAEDGSTGSGSTEDNSDDATDDPDTSTDDSDDASDDGSSTDDPEPGGGETTDGDTGGDGDGDGDTGSTSPPNAGEIIGGGGTGGGGLGG